MYQRIYYKFFLSKKGETDFDYFLKKQLLHYQENKPKLLKIDYHKNNILDEILTLHERINTNNSLDELQENIKTKETPSQTYIPRMIL